MIVKKIKTTISGKRREHQIGDLVDYIRSAKGQDAHEKLLYTGSRNFFAETHAGQKVAMIALARESTQSKMPVSHWVFSWPQGEIPSFAEVEQLVDIFLKEMGLEGHQAIFGLHGNTENIHLHVAINRMNSDTNLVVRTNNGFDIKQAHKALAVIENAQGWQPEDNARYRIIDGKLVEQAKRKKLEPSQRAQSFEQHTGIKSAERIAQEEAHAIIQGATSWEDLHAKLAPLGMRYFKKGSGAIIEVDGVSVKASSVDRAFALGKMEKRLGKFVPSALEEEQTHPRPVQPVSQVNMDEWRVYQEEMCKHDHSAIRQQEQQVLDEQRRKLDEVTKAQFAKVPDLVRQHGRYMGNLAKGAIKEDSRKKRRKLLQDFRANRRKLSTKPPFKHWLHQKGLHDEADKWRYRNRIGQLSSSEIPPQMAQASNQKTSAVTSYQSLFAKVHKKYAGKNINLSRVDAIIAVKMRALGHTKDEVAAAIRQCAPKVRKGDDARAYQWDDYASRTADYAFGPAGAIALQKLTEQERQERKESGAELADQIAQKKRELDEAADARRHAGYEVENAARNTRYAEKDIEEHKYYVECLDFWESIKSAAKDFLHGRELEKAYKAAVQNEEIVRNDYKEKAAVEEKLQTELRALETAFADTPLGKELKRRAEELAKQKRLEAERLQKEQEAKRQQELLLQKENEQHQGQQPSPAFRPRMR